MRFNRLKPLILHNLERCFRRHGISLDYFDEEELDDSLTHSENLALALEPRGLRTRAEERAILGRWRNEALTYQSETLTTEAA